MTDAAPSTTAPDGVHPEPEVVDDTNQLTPRWFDAVLGTAGTASRVRSVTTEPVGTGQMAATVRAHLDLGEGSRRTVVVKYGRADVESTMAAMAYAKEVAFYVELADKVAARTPDCLYAAIVEGSPRFVLVLEDLSDARQGDQIAGCSVAHAEAAVVNLAGLHGPTWCDAALSRQRWLGGESDDVITPDFIAPIIGAAADAFSARFASELDPVEAEVLDASRELLPAWMFARGERFAVVHGDYRLDNLLFPVDDPARVAAVDWQTTAVGPPGRDLAYFLETCLTLEDRRGHERSLVAAYHRALADHDVTGYDLDTCWDDYVDGMLHGPLIILLGRLTAGVTVRGDEMFRVMWRRASAAIDDHGTVARVRARLGGSAPS
jgi:aminoglycoside/choline kinase family phosphotransferase